MKWWLRLLRRDTELVRHDSSSAEVVARIAGLGLATESISTRVPTLDDVYLRLTGSRLDAAA